MQALAQRHNERRRDEIRLEEQRQKAARERIANLCSVIVTVQTGKKVKPQQFLPKDHDQEPGKPKRRLSLEETKDSFQEFAMKTQAVFGGKRI